MINNQKSVGTGRAAAAAPLDKYSAALSSLSAVSQQSLSTLSAVSLILSHTGGAQNTSSWFYKTIIFRGFIFPYSWPLESLLIPRGTKVLYFKHSVLLRHVELPNPA